MRRRDGIPTTAPSPSPPLWLALAWALLLVSGLHLAACTTGQEAPPDPYARYRAAMQPAYQSYLDDLDSVPRYDIEVSLEPDLETLQGTAQVAFTNTSPEPWDYLVFRLYPALKQYGGRMEIRNVAVNNQPTAYTYLDPEATAVRINPPNTLLPGEQALVYLSWTLFIPQWSGGPSAYYLFGHSQDMVSLPLFYPSLAVYEPGPAVGTGQWWLEQGVIQGDAPFNYAALFAVTATLPADQVAVTSGTLVSSTLVGDDRTQYVWVAGPIREFLLHTSNRFEATSVEVYGTQVTSYWLPEQEAAGMAALQYTAAALRIYSDRFGPYPYQDMRIAAAPLSFRAMEYPQVSLLGVELYGRLRSELEIRAVHEMAHQWWYQMVHNDPVNLPWLDEGLAEYSSKLYYEAMRGLDYANRLQVRRWQAPVDRLREENLDAPLNLPVTAYGSDQYEILIYGKGALFFDAVRQALGDRLFERALQEYVERYRFQIVTAADLLSVFRPYNQQAVDNLYPRLVEN